MGRRLQAAYYRPPSAARPLGACYGPPPCGPPTMSLLPAYYRPPAVGCQVAAYCLATAAPGPRRPSRRSSAPSVIAGVRLGTPPATPGEAAAAALGRATAASAASVVRGAPPRPAAALPAPHWGSADVCALRTQRKVHTDLDQTRPEFGEFVATTGGRRDLISGFLASSCARPISGDIRPTSGMLVHIRPNCARIRRERLPGIWGRNRARELGIARRSVQSPSIDAARPNACVSGAEAEAGPGFGPQNSAPPRQAVSSAPVFMQVLVLRGRSQRRLGRPSAGFPKRKRTCTNLHEHRPPFGESRPIAATPSARPSLRTSRAFPPVDTQQTFPREVLSACVRLRCPPDLCAHRTDSTASRPQNAPQVSPRSIPERFRSDPGSMSKLPLVDRSTPGWPRISIPSRHAGCRPPGCRPRDRPRSGPGIDPPRIDVRQGVANRRPKLGSRSSAGPSADFPRRASPRASGPNLCVRRAPCRLLTSVPTRRELVAWRLVRFAADTPRGG